MLSYPTSTRPSYPRHPSEWMTTCGLILPRITAKSVRRHDLGVDPPVPLENAEHDRLAAGATATLGPDAARAEVALVDFDLATLERSTPLTLVGQAFPQAEVDVVHRADRDAAQPRGIGRGQVQCEQAQGLAETTFALA